MTTRTGKDGKTYPATRPTGHPARHNIAMATRHPRHDPVPAQGFTHPPDRAPSWASWRILGIVAFFKNGDCILFVYLFRRASSGTNKTRATASQTGGMHASPGFIGY